ncbi:uncharacterized protein K02A2.6-like [Saccostrea cucullata]|uniref:uncharacterized protein K02A2.6-like n=1 Tax=Saccostrea cuccullata TaxID=36930 RepID=UPI002ED2DA2E
MRNQMVKTLHSSHLGIVKCKSRARESLFWPGMASQIEEEVSRCSICALNSKQNPKESLMIITDTPGRPWSIVSTDLFEYRGGHYLVTIDHYSKWPEIARLENLSSTNTITHLKSQFSKYGIPDQLISDNGPQFSSKEFVNFARSYGFLHKTSSPHFAQSNGQAERTVQTVKNLLRKAKDPYKAMLAYRNTAIEDLGLSPAQLFLGRMLKTDIPTAEPLLHNPKMTQEINMRLKTRKWQQKINFDKHVSKTPLRDLNSHENVLMRNNNKWCPATVTDHHASPRSYILQDNSGRKFRRNRKHIRPTKAQIHVEEPVEPYVQEDIPTVQSTDDVPDQQKCSLTSSPCDNPVTTRSGRVIKQPERFKDCV